MTLPELPFPTSTVILYSIAAAAIAIYLPFLLVAYGRIQLGPQAIATPRAMVDKLPDYAQRATWAHQNGFETFIIFGAAAFMAYVTGVQAPLAGWAAIAFVVGRLLYPMFYILNIPVGRSLMFAIGMTSTTILFVLSLQQAV